MKKLEAVAISILFLIYLFKILGITYIPNFALINFIVFLIISIGGYWLYSPKESQNLKGANYFSVFCGLAFSFGLIGFGLKVWNHTNTVALTFSAPNIILFLYLVFRYIKNGRSETLYFKHLLVRSSALITLLIAFLIMPFDFINVHLNKEQEILYNRGLGKFLYKKSIELSNESDFEMALNYANNSRDAYIKSYGMDSSKYRILYNAYYQAYYGLLLKSVKNLQYVEALKYGKLINNPTIFYYGDSSKQEAITKMLVASVYDKQNKYSISDSLFIESLNLYETYFGTRNMFYSGTLQLIANSFRDRGAYDDASYVYSQVLKTLSEDSTTYTSKKDPASTVYIFQNAFASAYSEIAYNYSLQDEFDSADFYFEKAFNTTNFNSHEEYPRALIKFAQHYFNKGDLLHVKELMKNALEACENKFGEIDADYLAALDGLNSINFTLGNYVDQDIGTRKATKIYQSLASQKDDYYGYLVYKQGSAKNALSDYDSALALFKHAINYSLNDTIQHADILVSLSKLNNTLGNYKKARLQSKQALNLVKGYYKSETSESLVEYLRNEAYNSYLAEEIDYSRTLYLRCISIDSLYENQKKLSYASTLNGLGLINSRQNKFKQADSLFNLSIKIYNKLLGESHPDIAMVLYNKGYLKLEEKKPAEAKKMLKQSHLILTNFFDKEHDLIADNLRGMGEAEVLTSNFKRGLKFFKKAQSIYDKKFGLDHKNSILTSDFIEYCKEKIENDLPTIAKNPEANELFAKAISIRFF